MKKELTEQQKLAKKEADRKYREANKDKIKANRDKKRQEKIDSGVIIKQYNLPDGLDLDKTSDNYITKVDFDKKRPYVFRNEFTNNVYVDTYLITELKNKDKYKQIRHKNYFYDFRFNLLLFSNCRPETAKEIVEDLNADDSLNKLLIILEGYLKDKVFFPNQDQINEVIEEEDDYDNNKED